jgi:glycosyltransferase involved in cell wall biosynthesis
MIRVLHITDSLRSGGKERQLIELLKGLEGSDINCQLVVLSDEIHYKPPVEKLLPMITLKQRRKKDPLIIFDLLKACKQHRPEIIHAWDSMSTVCALPIKKVLSVPLVNGMIREAVLNRKWYEPARFRFNLTASFSDCIVANSMAGLKAFHVKPGRGICVYNGFNFDRLKSIVPKTVIRKKYDIITEHVVGMVASFTVRKDHVTFIKAAQLLLEHRRDVTFILVGDGPNLAACKTLVQSKNHDHIRFLGKCFDVESIVNTFDIGVLATFTEGISNSIMEYMSLGKPVVATTCDGNAELIIDGCTGFLVRKGDPVDLHDKIKFLIEDKEIAYSLGLSGRQRLMEVFPFEKMCSAYISLYSSLV